MTFVKIEEPNLFTVKFPNYEESLSSIMNDMDVCIELHFSPFLTYFILFLG